MAVIDAHAHIYPEKIASKAVDAVGAFYGVDMYDGGVAAPVRPRRCSPAQANRPSRTSSSIRSPRRRTP